ncbi:MAG: hypothetical protein AAGC55_20265, partial [Myxococcota bacterium]
EIDLVGGPVRQRVELHIAHPPGAALSVKGPKGKPNQHPPQLYTHRVVADLPRPEPTVYALSILRATDADQAKPAAPRVIATPPGATKDSGLLAVRSGGDVVVFPTRAIADSSAAAAAPPALGQLTVAAPGSDGAPAKLRLWWSGFEPGAQVAITARPAGGKLLINAELGPGLRADSAGLVAATIDGQGTVAPLYTQSVSRTK